MASQHQEAKSQLLANNVNADNKLDDQRNQDEIDRLTSQIDKDRRELLTSDNEFQKLEQVERENQDREEVLKVK